jgi:electron transport complex protein RnfC
MVQHTGAPAKPAVAIGAVVRKGQKIGEAQGAVSAPVHASISGKVTAIGNFLHPYGREVPSIVIESDGTDEWAEEIAPPVEPEGLGPAALRTIISEAGIVGMGGAAFPTAVKLNPPARKMFETLVMNGAECEPYLTSDHRLMASTRSRCGRRPFLKQIWASAAWSSASKTTSPGRSAPWPRPPGTSTTRSRRPRAKYPQEAKQVIKAVLDREVPRGLRWTSASSSRTRERPTPFTRPSVMGALVRRIVTVTGPGIAAPKNLWARIGTPIKDLIAAAGGFKGEPGRVIMGDR